MPFLVSLLCQPTCPRPAKARCQRISKESLLSFRKVSTYKLFTEVLVFQEHHVCVLGKYSRKLYCSKMDLFFSFPSIQMASLITGFHCVDQHAAESMQLPSGPPHSPGTMGSVTCGEIGNWKGQLRGGCCQKGPFKQDQQGRVGLIMGCEGVSFGLVLLSVFLTQHPTKCKVFVIHRAIEALVCTKGDLGWRLGKTLSL